MNPTCEMMMMKNFRKSDGKQLFGLQEEAQRVNVKDEVDLPDSQLQEWVQGTGRSDLEGETVSNQLKRAQLELQETAKLPCSSVIRDTLSSQPREREFVCDSNGTNSLGRMEQSKAVIYDPYSSCQGFAQFSISTTSAYDEYKRSHTISCGKVDYEKATKHRVITIVAADPHCSMKETLEAPGEAEAEGLPLVQNQLELESRMFLRQEYPGQGYSTVCGSPEKVKEYKSTQVDTAAAIPSSSKLRAEINTTNLMGVLSITCSSSGTKERRTDFTTGPWKVRDLNQEGLSNHQGMLQEVQGDLDDLHSEHCDGVHGQEPAEVQDSARVDIMGPSTLG